MPPLPTSVTISYGPSRAPALSGMAHQRPLRSSSRRQLAQAEGPEQTMQVRRVDPQQARRRREVAARALDRLENQPALGLEHALMVRGSAAAATDRNIEHRLRQVVGDDAIVAAEDDRALDSVL